jgi:hypothetical protein
MTTKTFHIRCTAYQAARQFWNFVPLLRSELGNWEIALARKNLTEFDNFLDRKRGLFYLEKSNEDAKY